MYELAFNSQGDPIDVPSGAVGWLVRRLRHRGPPELVYGHDGLPLVMPIDMRIADFRRAVRQDGLYRLQVADEHRRPVPEVPEAYVCLRPRGGLGDPERTGASAPSADTLLEIQRTSVALATAILDQLPALLDCAEALLRTAADAAEVITRNRELMK